MFKLVILLVVGVIGYIAYTGADVSEEYDSFAEIRNQVLTDIFDPLAKNALEKTSESNLDQVIDDVISEYTGEM